jgi:ribonucleoside-diphosphate reductase beta chain
LLASVIRFYVKIKLIIKTKTMLIRKKKGREELQLQNANYNWAVEMLDQAIANTWFPHEAPMAEDLVNWAKMSEEEKNAVIMYIGFSNPMEFEVNESILQGMMPYISATEVKMYLVRQMWEEVNHSMTFDYIINTLQIDRNKAFNTHNNVKAVQAKENFLVESIEFMEKGDFDIESPKGAQEFIKNIVRTNIVTEGIWFYTGFMFALSFRQRNIMRNLGTLTDWISRDEALHLKAGINIILTVLEEQPEIVTPEFAQEIREIIIKAVELESNYNSELLPNGILGLNSEFINKYVRYIADRRLEELGFAPEYNVPNPAKWMSTANDTYQLVNFFESVNTSYEVNGSKKKE